MISEEIRYLLKPSVVALVEYQIGYVDYLKLVQTILSPIIYLQELI